MTTNALRLCAALALCASSCSVGAPPGFSAGAEWSFPLVDPLANGLLVTPVMIKGKGPYLFAIDPDAENSVIDERVAMDAQLRIDHGYTTRLRGDDGVLRPRFNAELLDIRIGNLSVDRRYALVVPHETLAPLGHDIRGVLGRKFIEDSLVFGFDRDRGIGWLETTAHFKPRPDATRVDVKLVRAADNNAFGADSLGGNPTGRSTVTGDATNSGQGDNRPMEVQVTAAVGAKQLTLDVTLGALASRVRPTFWDELGLTPPAKKVIEVDATGALREVDVSGTPTRVALGAAVNPATAIGAYVNHEEMASSTRFLDGTLALDFFSPFVVAADWDAGAIYLSPRGAAESQTQLRIGRWGDLMRCPHAGCVTVSLVEPPAPAQRAPAPAPATSAGFAPSGDPNASPAASPPAAPPPAASPPFILHVARDQGADMPLEVRLRATGRGDLPDLLVELPAGARELLAPVRGDLHGAHYEVIDASPFAQPCGAPNTPCVR